MTVNKAAKEKKIPSQLELKLEINSEKYREFLLHECKYNLQLEEKRFPTTGAIDGHITYRYTPTRLGIIVKVECTCGRVDDITDYNW